MKLAGYLMRSLSHESRPFLQMLCRRNLPICWPTILHCLRQRTRYRFCPEGYLRDVLGWTPWAGTPEAPGQTEVLAAYTLALRQQLEREQFEHGKLAADQLRYWQPGMTIQHRLRIEAGHTVGKTKLAAGLVNHFFDCFTPSIIYTYAPTWEQVHDLLWKEIKVDRAGKGLPGKMLDLALERGPQHFARGRATHDAGGQGSERLQGQHGRYLMFVLDEAEGVADYVFDAVDSMTSGGIAIVLMLANPRTRTSRFHKVAAVPSVRNFRISCLQHPNVREGREIVPGAVRRAYVEEMLAAHAAVVAEHRPDEFTFEMPWQPGVIYRPDAEFLFRVLGVAPLTLAIDTLVPVGRFAAAAARDARAPADGSRARMGVDVARYGADVGTLYITRGDTAWRAARFAQEDTLAYVRCITREARALAACGVNSLHIRVDGGGGFGNGVIDLLRADPTLAAAFTDFQVHVVHFNGTPYAAEAYADLATEMCAAAADALTRLALRDPPDTLEADLCERRYTWTTRHGIEVKQLEAKERFKARVGRSPDDGDGLVLCLAPDYLFSSGSDIRIF